MSTWDCVPNPDCSVWRKRVCGMAVAMLTDLPNHVLFKVLRLLDDASLLALARSSPALLELIHRDEDQPIWAPRCAAYGVTSHQGWAESYRHLYLGLLRRFGCLLRQPRPDPPELQSGGELQGGSSHASHAETTEAVPTYHAEPAELGVDGGGSSISPVPASSGDAAIAEAAAEAESVGGGRRLWYVHDAPFGGLVAAVAEPPCIVLYSIIVHSINGPVRGLPFLRISLAPALQPAPAVEAVGVEQQPRCTMGVTGAPPGEAGVLSADGGGEAVIATATHRSPNGDVAADDRCLHGAASVANSPQHGGAATNSSVSNAPVIRCCCLVPNTCNSVGDLCLCEERGHAATARLAQLQPHEDPWLVFRCGVGGGGTGRGPPAGEWVMGECPWLREGHGEMPWPGMRRH